MFKQIVLSKVLNNEKNDKHPQIKSNKNESSVASLLEQQTHLSHLFPISILLINGFMYFAIYLIFFFWTNANVYSTDTYIWAHHQRVPVLSVEETGNFKA